MKNSDKENKFPVLAESSGLVVLFYSEHKGVVLQDSDGYLELGDPVDGLTSFFDEQWTVKKLKFD